jgi:hypothetical protein
MIGATPPLSEPPKRDAMREAAIETLIQEHTGGNIPAVEVWFDRVTGTSTVIIPERFLDTLLEATAPPFCPNCGEW